MDNGEIIKRLKLIYGDLYDYSLIKDSRTKEDVEVICGTHGIFKKRLERLLKGSGCPKCSGKTKKTFDDFVRESNIVHNGFYKYNDNNYINAHTPLKITCPIHGEFWQTPTNHLSGNGCPKCKGEKLKKIFSSNSEEFIKKARIIHNDDYLYDDSNYVNNSTPIKITCKKHGTFLQLPHNHLQGKGCPVCSQSKLEAHVAKLLDENKMKYTRQWHLPWNKRYSLDFFIDDCKTGIECQGIQHFEDEHFKDVTLEEIQKRDQYKLKSCNENGIRILYFSSIEHENCITNDNEMINKVYDIMLNNKEKFIEKSIKRHGEKYDYSKVEYTDSLTKVCIICPIHGEFWQTPQAHVRGNGCPKCANIKRGDTFRDTLEGFITKAKSIHKDKYDYSKVEYVNAMTKVCIICPTHGEFWMTPMAHLLGQGCPKCSGRGLSREEVIERFKSVHMDKYDYSKFEFTKMHDKSCIICKEHGEFWQTPAKHLLGQGCPKCSVGKRSKERMMTTSEFIEKSNRVHHNLYNYDKTEYKGTYEPLTITCPIHGDFKQKANYHLNGHGCPICGNNMSLAENEISEYIISLGMASESKIRGILSNNKEIDIYIPQLNIGIEYDGLKWHSEEFKDKNYHLNKTLECNDKGIRLVHIFEDEWENKKEIIKSMLCNILGKTPNRIYARKCEIREVNTSEKKQFLNESHIQGDVSSLISYGLYYNDELVSLMCFGKPRINLGKKTYEENEYELLRFCNKRFTNVIGAASKLFKHFINQHNPSIITSYCDYRWSVGKMYEMLGFELSHRSQPNYYYIQGNNRKNRFKFRKSELIKEGYDADKSEHEIMLERGIYRIYDCGALVYKWTKEQPLN